MIYDYNIQIDVACYDRKQDPADIKKIIKKCLKKKIDGHCIEIKIECTEVNNE